MHRHKTGALETAWRSREETRRGLAEDSACSLTLREKGRWKVEGEKDHPFTFRS